MSLPVSMTPRAVMPAEAFSWAAIGSANAIVMLLGIRLSVKPAHIHRHLAEAIANPGLASDLQRETRQKQMA